MNSDYSSLRPPAIKRKRSYTNDLDEEDFCDGNSKSWDDPTVLEELGLGMLESDGSSSDDGGLQDLIDCTSSDSNELTENVDQKCWQKKKKRKLDSGQREPLKEHVLVENEANIQNSVEDGAKIEKLKPSNCVIKNSQVSYGRDENGNRETTDPVCNNVFILSRLKKEEKPGGNDYFKMLPDELILSIFKCLDRRSVVNCCHVSRRMNRIAADEKLWMRADLSGRNLPKLTLGYMMRRGPLIIRLASASIPDPVCDPRQFSENFSCKIQYLDLSMAAISQNGLAKFLGYCTKLKKLSVENCTIGDKVAECIAQNKGLEVLNMTMCSEVTAKGLDQILTNCTRLQSLNIAWTGLTRAEVKVVSTKLPLNLERLNISGCRTNITDEDVIAILQCGPGLVALDISDSDLTEHTVNFIANNISGLESLAISRCYSIPLPCLRKLNKVDCLQYLDVFGMFSDAEINQLKLALDKIEVNQFMFSSVARPTVGFRRTSIWGLSTRD